MLSNQDIVRLIADATDNTDTSYKSMQELLLIIASCIGVDEDTGEAYIRVKSDDE